MMATTQLPLQADPADLLAMARENLNIIAELMSRYETTSAPAFREGDRLSVSSPSVIFEALAEMRELEQEQMRVLLLDTKNRILGEVLVYQGSVNQAQVRVCELFRAAIRANAVSIILVHNHPSGDPLPSPEDIRMTRETMEAGKLLDIEVLDHVVIGRQGFVSMRKDFERLLA